MKKRLFCALLALLMVGAIYVPQSSAADALGLPQAGDVTGISAQERAMLDLIDYDNVERMALDLTEGIGNRYTASFRRDMAVDYIMDEFRKAGYEPYVHEFTIQNVQGVVSNYRNGSIEMSGKKLMYYGPTYAADTAYNVTKAALTLSGASVLAWANTGVDLAVPEDASYGGKAVFVTMSGTSAPTAARYYNACRALQAAGAGAVVFEYFKPRDDGNTSYSRMGNTVTGAASVAITIPVGATLYNETHGLIEALDPDAEVKITMDTSSKGRSVVAVLPSATGSKKTVYVTSHLDSQISTPGMNDNASGTVMTIEMARALRNIPFDYNVAFICFDAEEVGLVGARRFCYDMTDEDRANFVANYNMDMVSTNQEDCVHMFLNISDSRLNALTSGLSNDDRMINLPAAVQVAKEYEVFNYSYLAALKSGFDMDYFNICYDTTTDHYAFVVEATRNGNNFRNMFNAVEYDWRRNKKGTSFEALYHKTGDTFQVNYSRDRMKKVAEIVALALSYSAKAYPSEKTGDFNISVDKTTREISVSGSGYAPNARLEVLGAYNAVPGQANNDFLDNVYTDGAGAFSATFRSARENWLGGEEYYVSVDGDTKAKMIFATKVKISGGALVYARVGEAFDLDFTVDGVKYMFVSGNPRIAQVDEKTGRVTPLSRGKTAIGLKADDGSGLVSVISLTVN
ncbi:MAG: M28 family peptidase [Clostridiales Family XIII bacterium]|jgi:aminopeptidase YwaD|nr:M28 family peptidase [Clostridiales Family XIII bacterium]